jgi:alpha-mannosidase
MQFFTLEKLARLISDLKATIVRDAYPITHLKYHEGDVFGAERPSYDDSGWQDFRVGETWGTYNIMAWFRARVPIPAHLRSRKLSLHVIANVNTQMFPHAEALCYVNGEAVQAFDIAHHHLWLPPEVTWQDEALIALKAWSGMLNPGERCRFVTAQLLHIDENAEKLHHMANTLHNAIRQLHEDSWQRHHLMQTLDRTFQMIDYLRYRSDEYYATVGDARYFLEGELAALRGQEAHKPTIHAVGHSHLDLAWLWPVAQTREKAIRTFTTQLHLMRQYPEHRFMHSTPQVYKWLERDAPALFQKVKAKIASGEWEITGGMWIEPDANIPSGESFVRQVLYGKQYMKDQFGVDTTVLWLPDVFGYSAALPQIMKRSGLKYFMTTKMSWSQTNRFPYETFRWRGLDGSEVLTHLISTPGDIPGSYTYNGMLTPHDIKGTWDNYQQKALNDQLLTAFGFGDGGGGPTVEMLEAARVLQDLPGFPKVQIGKVEDFFARLDQAVSHAHLPVWDGELYLEFHRGTLTSQAYNKRSNRQCEALYHDAEALSAMASLLTGASYPDYLREGWELLLFNQFHDILPGSSIREVYEDSDLDYATIRQIGEQALGRAIRALAGSIQAETERVVIFNTLGWERVDCFSLPYSPDLERKTVRYGDDHNHHDARRQIIEEGGEKRVLFSLQDGYGELAGVGYVSFPLVALPDAPPAESTLVVTPHHIENEYYVIRLNHSGQLVSILDKQTQREVLAPGQRGNVLQVFVDRPMNWQAPPTWTAPNTWDAWDIDPFYADKHEEITDLIEAVVEEAGPLRGTLRLRWRFHHSIITQRISVYDYRRRIDFRTEIDWRESNVLLKAAFPVNIRATSATYDIQFGNIERPTHTNTSWDQARFEVAAHKWVDLSEGNGGVALLNDGRYGHDVHDNVLRLTLLKSGIWPDPKADQRVHHLTYSLFPHLNAPWREEAVIREAYELNYPLHATRIPAQPDSPLPNSMSLAFLDSSEQQHKVLETIKKAEDGSGAWVFRLYEAMQFRREHESARLMFGIPVRRAVECNLMEEEERPVRVNHNTLLFSIAPYEIKTFKVWFDQ